MNQAVESGRSRPPSSQLVDVHVWLLPLPLWSEETNTALAHDAARAASVGFVRALPDWPLVLVRRQVEHDLDRDIPEQFLFLKGMGAHLVHVNVKQEQNMKVKSIFYSLKAPDKASAQPEVIFILPSSALRSPSRPLSLPWGSRQTQRSDATSAPPSRDPGDPGGAAPPAGPTDVAKSINTAAIPNIRNLSPPPRQLSPPAPPPPPPVRIPRLALTVLSRDREADTVGGVGAGGGKKVTGKVGAGKVPDGQQQGGRTGAGRDGVVAGRQGGGNMAAAAEISTTPATSATLDSGIGDGAGVAALESARSDDVTPAVGKRAVRDTVTFAPTAAGRRTWRRTNGDEDSDGATSPDSLVLPPPPSLNIVVVTGGDDLGPSVTPRRPRVSTPTGGHRSAHGAPAGKPAKVATSPSPRKSSGDEESVRDEGFTFGPPPPPPPLPSVGGGGPDAGKTAAKGGGKYSRKDAGKDGGTVRKPLPSDGEGGPKEESGGRRADFTHEAEGPGRPGERGVDVEADEAEDGRVRELRELQGERWEMERRRRELVSRIKESRSAMHARRTEAREEWKRRYLQEKRATPALEEALVPIREELSALLSRHVHLANTGGTGGGGGNATLKDTLLARLQGAQQHVEKLIKDIESSAAKLRSEQKLRKDAQQELKAARAQLAQRKALASVARKPGVAYGL